MTTYIVRYYCPKASKRGRGVQTVRFNDRAQAEDFARGRVLYGRPARVELEPAPVLDRGPELG